jgi:hypothetical protein
MKKYLLFVLVFFAVPLFGQFDSTETGGEEVLIPKIKKIGVFGGPNFKIGLIDKNVGLFAGGEGGVIFNNTFLIGGGGYDLITNVDAGSSLSPEMQMNMSYGGLILGYVNKSSQAVHYNLQFLIGSGEISWSQKNGWLIFKDKDEYPEYGHDSYFVFEPGVGVEMRLTKFFEMNFGLSYLMTLDVNSSITTTGSNGRTYIKTIGNKDLSGISGNIKFKFILSDLQMITDVIQGIIDDFHHEF